jgi:HAE1 family hydrophobic/amphiphilic exporter-1
MQWRWATVVVFAGLLGATYYVYNRVPQAFLPEEDPGYFISIVQAPPGASLDYTTGVMREAEKVLQGVPEVESIFSVAGFSFAGSAANAGLMFTLLKPFDQRLAPEQRLQGLLPGIRGQLFGISSRHVLIAPAPSNGR